MAVKCERFASVTGSRARIFAAGSVHTGAFLSWGRRQLLVRSGSNLAPNGMYLVGLGWGWVKFLAVFGASPKVLYAPSSHCTNLG